MYSHNESPLLPGSHSVANIWIPKELHCSFCLLWTAQNMRKDNQMYAFTVENLLCHWAWYTQGSQSVCPEFLGKRRIRSVLYLISPGGTLPDDWFVGLCFSVSEDTPSRLPELCTMNTKDGVWMLYILACGCCRALTCLGCIGLVAWIGNSNSTAETAIVCTKKCGKAATRQRKGGFRDERKGKRKKEERILSNLSHEN